MKAISIFELVFFSVLLLPVICFVIYFLSGYFINFNTLYFVFFLILLIFVFPSTLKTCSYAQKKYMLFFLVANILALLGHVVNGEGLIEYFRTFSGFYFFIVIGWLLYYLYYKKDRLNRLNMLFIRAGLFIATINLFQYLLLITDDLIIGSYSIVYDRYESIINYTTELNKDLADYVIIGYEYGEGLRPLGFFFDLHSQYYFPLMAIILIFFSGNGKLEKKNIMLIAYLFITIFLSGVKSAIYSIVLILFFMYLFSENKKKYTKDVIVGGIIVVVWGINKLVTFFTSSTAILELAQLWDHVLTLPYKLFVSYPITFFFGGSPSLRDDPDFYSEVYWVSILFYIGLLGFLVYIKSYKVYYLTKLKYNIEAFYVFLVFATSLMHYSVYNRGVNCFASALVFMYLFVYYENEQLIISQNRQLKSKDAES